MIIALDIVITFRFSINWSAVICSPTIIISIFREASSETYGPGVYFPSYKFPIYNFSYLFTFFAIFYFPFHKSKIQKILLYLSFISIRSHVANNSEGIDSPLIALGASWCLFEQVFSGLRIVSYWIDTLVLKLRETHTLLCCITLSSSREKPMQAQEVAGHLFPNKMNI